jgi:hypothetical protein
MNIDTTYAGKESRPARLADFERHAHWLLRIGLASVPGDQGQPRLSLTERPARQTDSRRVGLTVATGRGGCRSR